MAEVLDTPEILYAKISKLVAEREASEAKHAADMLEVKRDVQKKKTITSLAFLARQTRRNCLFSGAGWQISRRMRRL